MLGALGFENAYALAMTRKRAESSASARSPISPRRAPQMRIAGDYEFFGRPEWQAMRDSLWTEFPRAAPDAGGIHVSGRWRPARSMSSPAYTSDGRIAKYDLVVLDDPKQAIPPYDAILLVSPQARRTSGRLREALAPLIGASTSS